MQLVLQGNGIWKALSSGMKWSSPTVLRRIWKSASRSPFNCDANSHNHTDV